MIKTFNDICIKNWIKYRVMANTCNNHCHRLSSTLTNCSDKLSPSLSNTKHEIIIDSKLKQHPKPRISIIDHPYAIDNNPLDFTTNKFAVVELSGTQYKVGVDDVIVALKMNDIDIGQTIELDKVLLIGSRSNTIIGRPYIKEATVLATVEEITRDKKVKIFKMRRRKNSQTMKGFRRDVTILRITDIKVDDII